MHPSSDHGREPPRYAAMYDSRPKAGGGVWAYLPGVLHKEGDVNDQLAIANLKDIYIEAAGASCSSRTIRQIFDPHKRKNSLALVMSRLEGRRDRTNTVVRKIRSVVGAFYPHICSFSASSVALRATEEPHMPCQRNTMLKNAVDNFYGTLATNPF